MNTVKPKEQLEAVRNMFKNHREHSDGVDQQMFFFSDKIEYPLAIIHLPPFSNEVEKQQVFRLAFGCLNAFQTERIVLASDVWVNGMTPDEYDEWMKENKSLKDNPKSSSALMTVMYTNDNKIFSVVDEYGMNDDGTMFFKQDNKFDEDNLEKAIGLVPDIAREAYKLLYDDAKVHDAKHTNQYFAMLHEMGFLIGMSDMMFDSLGLNAFTNDEEE